MSPIAATRPAATIMLTPVMVSRPLTDGSSITCSAITRSRSSRSSPSRSSSRRCRSTAANSSSGSSCRPSQLRPSRPNRSAQRARRQAETPLIVLCRFPGPALITPPKASQMSQHTNRAKDLQARATLQFLDFSALIDQ